MQKVTPIFLKAGDNTPMWKKSSLQQKEANFLITKDGKLRPRQSCEEEEEKKKPC